MPSTDQIRLRSDSQGLELPGQGDVYSEAGWLGDGLGRFQGFLLRLPRLDVGIDRDGAWDCCAR